MSRLNTKQWLSTITGSSATGGEPEIRITSPVLDRANDRVLPSGADVSNFLRNPILTWSHSRDEIPVGTITALDIGPESRIRWRWLTGDPFADRVKNAWDQGVVRASSIEFLPKPGGTRANADGGFDYTSWELTGVSLCPTPCNPQAVRAFKTLGLWPEKAGKSKLAVDREAFEKWLHSSPCVDGTKGKQMETATEVDYGYRAMDERHVVVAAVKAAYERLPRHGMGFVAPTPDFAAMEPDYIPPEARGLAGCNPVQRDNLEKQLLHLKTGGRGPVRSHGINLTGSEGVTVDSDAIRASLRRALQQILPEIVQRAVTEHIAQARARVD